MNYREQIERHIVFLRAGTYGSMQKTADSLESLLAENERLKQKLGDDAGEPVVSFRDFKWACGHNGPAVCKQCWDEKLARNTLLEAVLREFFWVGIVYNDHNFRAQVVQDKCRKICKELGITNVEDANAFLANAEQDDVD